MQSLDDSSSIDIEKKREELREFFKDAKFPAHVIEKVIENELRPVNEVKNKHYLTASSSGEVKSEFEVMTGQPFTKIDENQLTKPLSTEEIKEMIKDDPVIAEKARQIQIVTSSDAVNREVCIPLEALTIKHIQDINEEKEKVKDNTELNKLNFQNMQDLMRNVNDYKSGSNKTNLYTVHEITDDNECLSDEDDLQMIENIVSQYTDKSYETRLLETKDMLSKIADVHDGVIPAYEFDHINTYNIEDKSINEIDCKTINVIEKVKEQYAINDMLNLNTNNFALVPKSSGADNMEEIKNIKSNNIENKLKHTEDVLQNISCILDVRQDLEANRNQNMDPIKDSLKADMEDIKFNEMKILAKNIVEEADNISLLIKGDITNKLNSMNELLTDVNTALENSRKSNEEYQKIKNETIEISIANVEDTTFISKVTDSQIDDIYSNINKLNEELQHHQERIDQSKERYEKRNEECKQFMTEVDEVLLKSRNLLHPLKKENVPITDIEHKPNLEPQEDITKQVYHDENVLDNKNVIDLDVLHHELVINKDLEDFKKQELDRNERINTLLVDIKDKMKDNEEVLRLANNLLHQEECRKEVILSESKIKVIPEVDERAKGDFVSANGSISVTMPTLPSVEINKESRIDKIEREEKLKKEKRLRELRVQKEKELEEQSKYPKMTKQFIRNHCKQHKLYCTPHLNNILYLHFKGFSKIENLEEYTGLKCIFLENNGIQRIEGLDTLADLKCLYLHYNVIRKIENLDGCRKLDTLNLDHNFVQTIENLDVVPDLHTLSIAHNMLNVIGDLEQLRACENLSVLDLSYNRIEDPLIVDVLADMNILKVLVLTGNPVVRNIPAYRKTLTLRLKELLNLDNRPVFPRDRACAEAWQRGGVQEEIAERKRWIAKDQEKTMESVRYLIKMRDEKRAERAAREKLEMDKLDLIEKVEVRDPNLPPTREQLYEPEEVETKDGIAVNMFSASEPEDSTSEDSGSESGEDKSGARPVSLYLPGGVPNIEWSKIDEGKRLIQEIKDTEPLPTTEDVWHGYGVDVRPHSDSGNFKTDFEAMSNLLFVDSQKTLKTRQREGNVFIEDNEDAIQELKTKPLIEIIEPQENISLNNVTNKIVEIKSNETITKNIEDIEEFDDKVYINNDDASEIKSNNGTDVKIEINSPEEVKKHNVSLEDLPDSKEDLEIFSEIDREMKERQVRIDNGEPSVDPMKLYDKQIMEDFHGRENYLPAHEVMKQEKEKIKLEKVKGGIIFEFQDKQILTDEIKYEIGEENIEIMSTTSTETIISDNSNKSPKSVEDIEELNKNVDTIEVKEDIITTKEESSEIPFEENDVVKEDADKAISYLEVFPSTSKGNYEPTDDEEFVSADDAEVDEDITQQLMRLQEEEYYSHCKMLTSHAGKVDNQTNVIMEELTAQPDGHITLPDVSKLIEAHMSSAEQRWRSGEFIDLHPSTMSYDDDDVDDDEDNTLVPLDSIFETTLTDTEYYHAESEIKDDIEISDDGCMNEHVESINNSDCKIDDVKLEIGVDCKIDNDELKSDFGSMNDHVDLINTGDCNIDDVKLEGGIDKIDNNEELKSDECYINDNNKLKDDVDYKSDNVELKSEDDTKIDQSEVDGNNIDEYKSNDKDRDRGDFKNDKKRVNENYSLEMKLVLGIGDKQ